jgi:hypothetical protein
LKIARRAAGIGVERFLAFHDNLGAHPGNPPEFVLTRLHLKIPHPHIVGRPLPEFR